MLHRHTFFKGFNYKTCAYEFYCFKLKKNFKSIIIYA